MSEINLFQEDEEASRTADITQESLIDTKNRLGSMLDVMPIGLLFHTEQAILFANREACQLFRSDRHQLFGQHFMDFVGSSEVGKASSLLRSAFLGSGETVEAESIIRDREGNERLVNVIAGKLPWEGNPVIQLLVQDITDQKSAEIALQKLTITDDLTGAYNRRHVFRQASLYIEEMEQHSTPLSVILSDIDHFKSINDTYGHAVGDLALRQLANLAHDFVPKISSTDPSLFARVGGEEFLMLLPGLDIASAEQVAEQFRKGVEQLSLQVEGREDPLGLTISLGVASYRTSDGSADGLLARADKALYRAKSEGRNRVSLDV